MAVVIFRRFDPWFRILYLVSSRSENRQIMSRKHTTPDTKSPSPIPHLLSRILPSSTIEICAPLCVNQIVPDGTVYTRHQRCLPKIVMIFFKEDVKDILEPLRVWARLPGQEWSLITTFAVSLLSMLIFHKRTPYCNSRVVPTCGIITYYSSLNKTPAMYMGQGSATNLQL